MDYDRSDYYDALVKKIEDRIESLKRTQEKENSKLKEKQLDKKSNLSSKLEISSIQTGIKNRQNSIDEMISLRSILTKINNQNYANVGFQAQVSLREVLKYLDQKDQETFRTKVSECVKKSNDAFTSKIDKDYNEAFKIIKRVFPNSKIFVQHGNNYKTNYELTTIKALDLFVNKKKSEAPKVYLGPIIKEIESNIKGFKEDLALLLNNPSFKDYNVVKTVQKNYELLINLNGEYLNTINALQAITNAIGKVDGRIFGDLIKFLQEKQREQQLKKQSLNKKLERIININELNELIKRAKENKKAKENMDIYTKIMKKEYSDLAFELEMLQSTGGSIDRINKIKRRMEEIRKDPDLDVRASGIEGVNRFKEQVKRKEEEKLEAQRIIEKEKIKRAATRALDTATKKEYESQNRSNWKFKPLDKSSSEYKSIRSSLIYKASLSAEERTLYNFKESGIIRSDATLTTLTPEERAQIDRSKEYFTDDRTDYIAKYKKYINSLDEGEIPML